MAITQGIVELCEQHAQGRPVQRVVVEIGALSGVVPEAVQFCFEACCAGTLLDGACLTIVRLPGRGRCLECQCEQECAQLFDPCSRCGSYCMQIVSGEELRVREIEVAA